MGGLEEVGAQAGAQSEHCPHPWENWEAGAESKPHPLQPRVPHTKTTNPTLFLPEVPSH